MLAFCLLDDVANKEFFSNFFLLYTKDSVHICICKYHVSFSLRLLFVQSFEASYGFWFVHSHRAGGSEIGDRTKQIDYGKYRFSLTLGVLCTIS